VLVEFHPKAHPGSYDEKKSTFAAISKRKEGRGKICYDVVEEMLSGY
jgi:expansin (peptidoglycan-binding protein)